MLINNRYKLSVAMVAGQEKIPLILLRNIRRQIEYISYLVLAGILCYYLPCAAYIMATEQYGMYQQGIKLCKG